MQTTRLVVSDSSPHSAPSTEEHLLSLFFTFAKDALYLFKWKRRFVWGKVFDSNNLHTRFMVIQPGRNGHDVPNFQRIIIGQIIICFPPSSKITLQKISSSFLRNGLEYIEELNISPAP